MSLHLPRELDLRLRDDRRLLREVVSPNQRVAALVDEHLEDYITLFKDAAWRKLHPWGFEVMLSSMHFSLETLLVVTGTLKKLSKYPGFCRLMTGFNSHDQVRATLFEIQVADWCIERGVTKLVEFSPSVQLRGRTKRPDLLWQTTLGALYCECKTPDQFNNRLTRRLDRLHKIAEQEYSQHATWAPDLRLDIFLSDAPDGVERNIRNLVRRAAVSRARAANEREIVDGPVRGVFRHRQQTPLFGDGELDESGTLSVASVTVGPVAVGLNDAHIRTTIDVANYSPTAAARLLREARRQLPPDRHAAVFICLKGESEGERAIERIKELLAQVKYRNTPWVAIWTPSKLYAAWHNGQPFDGRLLLDAAPLPPSVHP